MTFLQPMTGAITSAVGLGLLTLLYVLKLRRKTIRVGSVMLWEQALADVEVNTPWRRLRLDALFVVQALAILALAGAVARPAIGIGSARQRVVIVIDTSASMAAIDGKGTPQDGQVHTTRLQEARQLAAEFIENLHRARGVEAGVVVFAADASITQSMVSQATPVLEAIAAASQTDEPGNLSAAMETVATLAGVTSAANEEESTPTIAYVFSDGGFSDQTVESPPGVVIRLIRVGPTPGSPLPQPNVGILSTSARRDESDPAIIQVVVRLVSTHTESHEVALRLDLDQRPVGSATAPLKPGSREHVVTVPVNIGSEGGMLRVRVMNSDALATDNAAHLFIDPAREPSIVVVAPGDNGSSADALVMNFANVASPRARLIGLDGFASYNWQGVDLLILDRVEIPSTMRLPAIPSVSLGAGLPSLGVTVQPAGSGRDAVVLWKRDHPMMRDVVLDTLKFQSRIRLDLPPAGQTLAEGIAGPLIALVNGSDGVPRLVTAFGSDASAWGADLSFVVFMGNALDQLTLRGLTRNGRQFSTGIPLQARVSAGTQSIIVTDPQGMQRSIIVPSTPGVESALLPLGRARTAGVYTVTGAVEADRRLAVNLNDTIESSLATADSLPTRSRIATTQQTGTSRPREIWDWFVLAAIGLLAVEWCLYAFRASR